MIAIESARVAFAGTPEFAVPCLRALIGAGAVVSPILTQPDRPAGRGRELKPPPVKQLASQHGIAVHQPAALDDALRRTLEGERPDLLVVVAYGLILPEWLLQWPAIAAVNVHASLLPRWRGAAPIQHAILAGDELTGVSIMRMTRGLDSGPVYQQASTPIGPAETAGSLHDRLADLGAALLIEVLPAILAGTLEPGPQDAAGVCHAPKIEKRDAAIDWSRTAAELARFVRAYNPWPVAETETTSGRRLRVWAAEALAGDPAVPPGTVVDAAHGAVDVATGAGVLRLTMLQSPGGRAMPAEAYLAAHDLGGARFVGPG
jgi:methionyl-tRNA formyltransferase